MPKTRSKREKGLFFVMAAIVIMFSLYKFVITAQWQTYQNTKAEIQTTQAVLDNMRATAEKALQSTSTDKVTTKTLSQIRSFNPGDEGTILIHLNDLANKNGLALKTFKPIPGKPEQLPSKTVEIKLTGPYSGLVGFVSTLDNPPYLTQINLSTIQKPSSSNANLLTSSVEATLTLKIYNLLGPFNISVTSS